MCRNPLPHIENLDVSCYDREYAPEPQRRRAREAHLAQWPDAVDASLESLTDVPAPVAGALLPTVRGLAAGINGTTGAEVAAVEAHGRLLRRIHDAAASGSPDASLGATTLARLLGHPESMPVDLGRLEERADQERDRLGARLTEACERLSPGRKPSRLVMPTTPSGSILVTGNSDAELEVLVCQQCNCRFERMRVRGRKPALCPPCRTTANT
jgi:hypothetical protein